MFINDAPKPDKVCFKNKYIYKSEFNSYFADDNIIMTAGIEDGTRARTPSPKDVLFGNKRFRELVQQASNWEDAHRIKTNASKSVIMFSGKKPKAKKRKLLFNIASSQ